MILWQGNYRATVEEKDDSNGAILTRHRKKDGKKDGKKRGRES